MVGATLTDSLPYHFKEMSLGANSLFLSATEGVCELAVNTVKFNEIHSDAVALFSQIYNSSIYLSTLVRNPA